MHLVSLYSVTVKVPDLQNVNLMMQEQIFSSKKARRQKTDYRSLQAGLNSIMCNVVRIVCC